MTLRLLSRTLTFTVLRPRAFTCISTTSPKDTKDSGCHLRPELRRSDHSCYAILWSLTRRVDWRQGRVKVSVAVVLVSTALQRPPQTRVPRILKSKKKKSDLFIDFKETRYNKQKQKKKNSGLSIFLTLHWNSEPTNPKQPEVSVGGPPSSSSTMVKQ